MLKEFKRGSLKYKGGLDYSLCVSELWPDKNDVKKKLFVESHIDTEVKLEFLDVASIHCY